MHNSQSRGFTLIELSIVLVIIGLIVGGVLVGRDLIHAAEIRATISQIERMDTAVNTFHNKYDCLPGDCTSASAMGFTACAGGCGGVVNGNGDELISGATIEQLNALSMLGQAGLLNISVSTFGGNLPYYPPKIAANDIGGHVATWTITYMAPATNSNISSAGHYYWANTFYIDWSHSAVFIPADNYAMDVKMDDGYPRSGRIISSGNDTIGTDASGDDIPMFNPATDVGAAGASSNFCVTNSSPALYNTQNASRVAGNLCTITIKTSF